jgi:hypothetical protein
MYRNALGLIRRTILSKGWKDSNIKCYKARCICSKCGYSKETNVIYPQCQIKAYVLELVKKFGVPKPGVLEDDGNQIQ